MKRALLGTMLALLFLGMLMSACRVQRVDAEPTTITVPDDYPSIQQAINAASSGDTIYVRAGIYDENVLVYKTLSLIGEDEYATIMDARRLSESVIEITANDVMISGFTVRNAVHFGIALEFVADCNVTNIIATDSFPALATCGIFVHFCNSIIVSNSSTFQNGQEGILVENSNDNIISDNNASSNGREGISIGGFNNIISGNSISNNSDGICLWGGSNNILFDNNASSNGQAGIRLFYSANNTVTCNIAANNSMAGIVLQGSDNIVSGNNISSNPSGIRVFDAYNNKIYHNNFVDNSEHAYVTSPSNIWDDGYPSGGNYWDCYNGSDLYCGPDQNESGSDGKGDTPYTIGPDDIDNYPLMKPYSWSPHGIGIASLALSKAVVGQGYFVRIEATILNQGVYPETLDTTLYAQNQADKFIIQTQTITLPEESPIRLTFTWNTSGFVCGNYTIGANATLIPSETDTTDNNLTDGWIIVTIPGDVTGEGLCDMQDISILIDAFLANPGDLRWNPNCNVNNDLSIDMADISIAIDHFMQT